MIDELRRVKLTNQRLEYANHWLTAWADMFRNIQDPEFTEEKLLWLIKEEATNRQRMHILKRLTGRYNKLRRQREWVELLKYMEY